MSQLSRRLRSVLRRRITQVTRGAFYRQRPASLPRLHASESLSRLAEFKCRDRCPQQAEQAAVGILQGRFRLLNVERLLPDPVDWRLENWPDAAHLWRFQLHYHEFLLDLTAHGLRSEDRRCFDRAWQLVEQWIDGNRLSDGRVLADAWHPYCISRRLPVWIHAWTAAPPDPAFREKIVGSMWAQGRYLEANLERDLGGNHLLENARALFLLGTFFAGRDGERWLQRGAEIVARELSDQLLPWGEHFERAPMYHAEMLELVLDVRDAAEAFRPELALLCRDVAGRMADFLTAILHPDGNIPLWGDSCLSDPALLCRLRARAGSGSPHSDGPLPQDAAPTALWPVSRPSHPADRRSPEFQETSGRPFRRVGRPAPSEAGREPVSRPSCGAERIGDYWRFGDGEAFLLWDIGPVGPDRLPAHAHADLLSLEASLGGRRLLVDSGVFCYESGAMRRYCRSTAAHNALELDGRDQCDMWSRFRMGARGWPGGFAQGQTGGFYWARSHHNAYRRLGVPQVGRWLACRPGGPWLCVDWAQGRGEHRLAARLHLHPEVRVQQTAEREFRLVQGQFELTLRHLAPGQCSLDEGWYCPQFGVRQRAAVVCWSAARILPCVSAWSLTWGGNEGHAALDAGDPQNVQLHWTDSDGSLTFQPLEQAIREQSGS